MTYTTKPCKCGGEAKIRNHFSWNRFVEKREVNTLHQYSVVCSGCGVKTDWHDKMRDAIKEWNEKMRERD